MTRLEGWTVDTVLEHAMQRVPILQECGWRKFFCGPESFTPDDQFHMGEAPELRIGEQLALADATGAEANQSRTKIHTIYSGLAETGGAFVNMIISDVFHLLDSRMK